MYNPSLRQEPIQEPAAVIPIKQQSSILDWLEEKGRLLARDVQENAYVEDEEEITALMAVDDVPEDIEEEEYEDIAEE
ncbi:MAG: hypothetical protein NVS2B14_09780 [Chamaesiphon sp.]